jgi:hypothetical protein
MLNETTWFALWTEIAVKSTVVLAIAWLTTLLLRRQSAALRHLVWTAASVAVLALPFFSLWLPAFEIPSVRSFAPAATLFETMAKPPADAAMANVTPRSSRRPRRARSRTSFAGAYCCCHSGPLAQPRRSFKC